MVKKPFSVAIRDTKIEIVNLLNNSGLPIDAMNFILLDILKETQPQAESAYQKEKADYISEINRDLNAEQAENSTETND